MLSLIVWWPLVVALVLVAAPALSGAASRWVFVAATTVELALILGMWFVYETPAAGTLAFEEQVEWIPGVNSSYHLGIDGLSLPLLAMTAVVFLACAVYSTASTRRTPEPEVAHATRERVATTGTATTGTATPGTATPGIAATGGRGDVRGRGAGGGRARVNSALFLFMQTTCMGVFAAQDLIVFFVFFDLSIVGMYFVIAGWGHGDNRRSALKFFLYTFLGSLALLLGFIGLYIAADPHTFDMVDLAAQAPLQGQGVTGGLVLAAILVGLAVKTPTVPFHTWLPPAHTDAPATGSAVLAGVMLKLGTYGFVRVAMPMLPDAWQAWAWVIITVGIVSVIYGALVALAQTDLKRMIAYTSINHMGYVVLGLGAAGLIGGSTSAVRETAVNGSVYQMVSHGLITAALFLLAGVFRDRAGTYDLHAYGGLAGPAPRLSMLFVLAAFASLGLPGFTGFIAEFQIFTGSIAVAPVTAVAVVGILLTAGLFLRAYQLIFTGPAQGKTSGFADLRPAELWSAGGLMVLAVVFGIIPRPLLDVIEPAAQTIVDLVGR